MRRLFVFLTLITACAKPDRTDGDGQASRKDSAGSAGSRAGALTTPSHPTTRLPLEPSYPVVRGLYVNRFAAQSPRKMEHLIAVADRTEVNALVIDMKDEFGLNYSSQNPEFRKLAGTAGVV